VIVERYLRGRDYRVLVTGDRVAAASWRRPPQVVGDGVSTVRELVDAENRNPARGEGHSNILTQIPLDEHALELVRRQGHDADSVPPAGAVVTLRDNANLSSGGTAEDVTDQLPQETVRICVRAARAIGLDIAGIDIVCEDIARPLREQGGGIIEVNAAPGIRMHEYPSAGQPRDAGDAIAESLFGQGDGRIPLIAVSGSHGARASVQLIAQAVRVAGLVAGVASADGVRIGDALTMPGDFSGYAGACAVLSDPEVELAVLQTSGAGVLASGLGFDRADVAVIVQVDPRRTEEQGGHAPGELARAYQVVARSAARAVVLNADDEGCVALGQGVSAGVEKLYFARQADNPVLQRHMAMGGRALYLQGGMLVLAIGQCHQAVLDVGARPGTVTDLSESNVAEVLAAAGALVGAGFAHQAVAAGMQMVALSGAYAPPRDGGAVNETHETPPPVMVA
jgi:cyanophycin synthetase